MGHVHQAGNVGVDHRVPVGQIHLLRWHGREGQAGIVDQRADLAKTLGQFSHDLLHGGGIAHIQRGDMDRHLLAQFILQFLQALHPTSAQHQRPATRCKTPRRGAPETGRSPGDENDLAHLPTSCCEFTGRNCPRHFRLWPRQYPNPARFWQRATEISADAAALFYLEKRFAPATQKITARVTPSMPKLTRSCSKVAANARPKNGCSNCSCPTAAMPPWARPRYQNTKPITMLNPDTYARLIQAGKLTSANDTGINNPASNAMTGNDSSSAQEITCQPPSVLDSCAPSA